MPIVLGRDETMEAQHKVSTQYGSGTLHVTSKALIVEIKGRGIVFHRRHDQMASMQAAGRKKIKLTWPEGANLFDFEFKAGGADKIVEEVQRRHPYASNYSNEGIARVIYTDKQRAEIRREREKWAAKKLKKAEGRLDKNKSDSELAADAESWRRLLQDGQHALCVRSTRVPPEVPDHLCWNDSWFTEAAWPVKSYYYTFNLYWLSGWYPKAPVRDGGLDKETGAYRIPAQYVRFFHGYPYVRGDAFESPIYKIGYFIPTLVEAALDDKILYLHYRTRERQKMEGDPPDDFYALLGCFTEPSEHKLQHDILWRMNETTVKYFYDRGFLTDDFVRRLGWKQQPTPEEIEQRLQADEAVYAEIKYSAE